MDKLKPVFLVFIALICGCFCKDSNTTSRIVSLASYSHPVYCLEAYAPTFLNVTDTFNTPIANGCYITPPQNISNSVSWVNMWQVRIQARVVSATIIDLYTDLVTDNGLNDWILKHKNMSLEMQTDRLQYFFSLPVANYPVEIIIPAGTNGNPQNINHTVLTSAIGAIDLMLLIQVPDEVALQRTFTYKLRTEEQEVDGRSELIARRGVSVIADMDETLKHFGFYGLDALASLLYVPYRPIEGMPEFVQRISQIPSKDLSFHYLSASPWQLIPSFEVFIGQYYPVGTYAVNEFPLLSGPKYFGILLNKMFKMGGLKLQWMTAMIKVLPERTFVMLGDSAITDPKEYGQFMRDYPDQTPLATIRRVPMGLLDYKNRAGRFDHDFRQVNKSEYFTYASPSDLDNVNLTEKVKMSIYFE